MPISRIRSLLPGSTLKQPRSEMVRTGEAGGQGVSTQFGEKRHIDDGRIKNEAVTVGQRPAGDIRQSSHFSKNLIVYRNDMISVKKRIVDGGQRLGCQ